MQNLVTSLKSAGVPIHGIGFESHFIVGELPADIQQNMEGFHRARRGSLDYGVGHSHDAAIHRRSPGATEARLPDRHRSVHGSRGMCRHDRLGLH